MLVHQQFHSGRNTWSSSKLGAIYHNAASPRMSNFDALSTQPDWRDQYSSIPPGEDSSIYGGSSTPSTATKQERSSDGRPQLEHRHSFAPLGLRPQQNPIAPIITRPDSAPGDCGNGNAADQTESALSSDTTAAPSTVSESTTVSTGTAVQQGPGSQDDGNGHGDFKEEDLDDDDDDDEMLDGDDGGVPQTAAERRAERRKMKRFRLTHQQTRFLMSEFAKQAHPDAAHRERLSREIPGLSPRQVQVWFQNRRAKIKRLTVDDRERMMKMRAVPDDFDNVQALHSPYGAVHGIGTPMQSPVDFVSGYADPMMRPLMVDTMRRHHESEDHMSPNGLSPAYGHMGFAPPGSMGTPDILSPLSLNSNDRYYSSHVSSPMSAGPRSANMFPRQTSTDNYQALSNSRQHVRSLQPLQVRTTMSRSRSESLQSPLRSSMSWKGENLDYGFTQTGQPSPQLSGRQASAYQGEHMGNNGIHASQYDPIAYSNANAQNSHGHMTYSTSHTSPSSLSRLRSSSSAFPPGLDLRNQYRTLPSQQQHHPSQHGMPPTPRSAAFNNAFSAGFASAPLSAPVDFNLPRTPGEPSAGTRDFSMPQLSAPMAPPQDFTNAYSSPLRAQHSDRDYHTSSLGHNSSPGSRMGDHKSPQHNEDSNFLRPSHDYEMGHKRKRSFTLPGAYETTP